MMRKGMWPAGLLALLLVAPAWCDASSPKHLGKRVRFLSRSEAVALALEHVAADLSQGSVRCRVRWLGLDRSEPASEQRPVAVRAVKVLSRANGNPADLVVTGLTGQSPHPEIDRRINQVLLNVETAYWNLYGAYWNLHSREQGLRQALETWCLACPQFFLCRIGPSEIAQIEGQYELFRSQRLTAIDQLLDDERQLRELLGMQSEDGTRLVPSDIPVLEEIEPDWSTALKEALKRRPELQIARRELALPLARLWLGSQLLSLAHATLADDKDCNKCGLHQAKQRVASHYLTLQDQELKTERFLGLQYRRIIDSYEQIKAQRAQREAFAVQVQLRSRAYRGGRGTADSLLEAQRFLADGLANECRAIVAYNNALACFDFACGRSQDRHHLTLSTDSPEEDLVPAVQCERQRTAEQVRRLCRQSEDSCAQEESEEQIQGVPSFALPVLWKTIPPLHEVNTLPPLRLMKQQSERIEQDGDELLPPPREMR